MSTSPVHNIREALTDSDISACFPVIHELRPHINSPSELLRLVKLQQEEGYHVMYISDTTPSSPDIPVVVSIMAYRISHRLFDGRMLYIDDLCTYSGAQKRGYAGALLDWANEKAKEEKCDVVSLISGYERSNAHRLYLNKRFKMTDHSFSYYVNDTEK